jgi:hypothetical protein
MGELPDDALQVMVKPLLVLALGVIVAGVEGGVLAAYDRNEKNTIIRIKDADTNRFISLTS